MGMVTVGWQDFGAGNWEEQYCIIQVLVRINIHRTPYTEILRNFAELYLF